MKTEKSNLLKSIYQDQDTKKTLKEQIWEMWPNEKLDEDLVLGPNTIKPNTWYKYSDSSGYTIKFPTQKDVDDSNAFGYSPMTGWNERLQGWSSRNLVRIPDDELFERLKRILILQGFAKGKLATNFNGRSWLIDDDSVMMIRGDDLGKMRTASGIEVFDGRYFRKFTTANIMTKNEAEKKFNIIIKN